MVMETKVLTMFGLKVTATGIPKKLKRMATFPLCSSVLQLHIPRSKKVTLFEIVRKNPKSLLFIDFKMG